MEGGARPVGPRAKPSNPRFEKILERVEVRLHSSLHRDGCNRGEHIRNATYLSFTEQRNPGVAPFLVELISIQEWSRTGGRLDRVAPVWLVFDHFESVLHLTLRKLTRHPIFGTDAHGPVRRFRDPANGRIPQRRVLPTDQEGEDILNRPVNQDVDVESHRDNPLPSSPPPYLAFRPPGVDGQTPSARTRILATATNDT